jgi:WD40 repeat protein
MDIESGKIVRRTNRITEQSERPEFGLNSALAVASDGKTLAVCDQNPRTKGTTRYTIWLEDAATGTVLRRFTDRSRPTHGFAFLAADRQIAALDDQGVITVLDNSTGEKVRELALPDRKFTALAASADGKILAAGTEPKEDGATVYLWDAATGKQLHKLAERTGDIYALAFAPDGRSLAAGAGGTVRLWDVATGRDLRQLLGHDKKSTVHSLASSPDGRIIASAATFGAVRVWETATGKSADNTGDFDVSPLGSAFLDNRVLLVGGYLVLRRRDVLAKSFAETPGHDAYVEALAFAPDGRTAVVADDKSIRTYGAADGRPLAVNALSCPSPNFCVSPDGRSWAFTTPGDRLGDPGACISDVTTGRRLHLSAHDNYEPYVFSPNGRWLATGPINDLKTDGVVRVWDAATGRAVGQLPIGRVYRRNVAIAPDGRSAYTATADQNNRSAQPILRWDIATGRVASEISAKEFRLADALAVSTGGRRLAVSGRGSSVRVFDVNTGRECWRGRIRNLGIATMAFSPDGTLLAAEDSGNGESQLDLFDVRTGQLLAAL